MNCELLVLREYQNNVSITVIIIMDGCLKTVTKYRFNVVTVDNEGLL